MFPTSFAIRPGGNNTDERLAKYIFDLDVTATSQECRQ